MIAVNNEREDTDWQTTFLTMLPELEKRLRGAFRFLDPEAREESLREAIAHSLFAYVRLHEQGRADAATPSSLAWYSSRQVKRGRPAAGRMNGKEPLSRYAQLGNGIQIERLQSNWIDTLVEDKRAPVADQVAAKLDVGAWFATLTQRMRQIAKDLAFGCSTSEVARKHGVTAGRISQLRRNWKSRGGSFSRKRCRRLHDADLPSVRPPIVLQLQASPWSAPARKYACGLLSY